MRVARRSCPTPITAFLLAGCVLLAGCGTTGDDGVDAAGVGGATGNDTGGRGGTSGSTLLPYANAMKDEAAKKTVEVEDLNLRSEEYYMSVGTSYLATNIFDGGTTHFIKAGAVKMAALIAGE
jgi:hypothetical protein